MNILERMRFVFEIRGLRGTPKLVLACLAFHANDRTLEAWPSQETIEAETGIEVTAIRKAVKELAAHGYITIENRRPHRYLLHLDERLRNAGLGNNSNPAIHPVTSEHKPCDSQPGTLRNAGSNPAIHSINIVRTDQEPNTPPAAAAAGRVDERSAVWQIGVAVLCAAGETEQAARRFIGKLRKDHGDDAVDEKVDVLVNLDVVDPKSWLIAALTRSSPPRKRPMSKLEEMRAELASRKGVTLDAEDFEVSIIN